LSSIFTGTYDKSSINNINTALDLLNKELNAVGSEAQRVEIRKTIKELDKLKDSYSGNTSSAEKKFANDKTKAAAQAFAATAFQELKNELKSTEYADLYDQLELATTDYNEILSAFRTINNQKDLDAYTFAKELMEKRIDLIRTEIREKKKEQDKERNTNNDIEGYINKSDADYLKNKKESARYLKEQDAKSTLDPFDQRKNELSAEEEVSVERARLYGATEEQILNIHNWYAQQRTQIDFQEQQARLSNWSRTLGQLAGLFNKHTAAYKILATAQVWIETYKGIAALYAPPPIGVGPLLAPFASAALYGMAGLQTANIMGLKTDMPGYNTGGILPAGKVGFFEGNHREIVAPEKDFISVVNDLIGQQRIALDGGYSGGNSSEFMKEIKQLNSNFEKYATRPIPAFITQDEFNKGYTEADYNARKDV
jgi:ATP-dependent Lon protease